MSFQKASSLSQLSNEFRMFHEISELLSFDGAKVTKKVSTNKIIS